MEAMGGNTRRLGCLRGARLGLPIGSQDLMSRVVAIWIVFMYAVTVSDWGCSFFFFFFCVMPGELGVDCRILQQMLESIGVDFGLCECVWSG